MVSKKNLCSVLLQILVLCRCNYMDVCNCAEQNSFRPEYTYISETNSYYKFHTLCATWIEATQTCASEGASLFYPEDEAEMKTLMAFWNQTEPNVNQMYLGISALATKGVFETVDGRPISSVYSKWCISELNDTDDKKDCVLLRKEEECFNDIECEPWKYPFICKKTKAQESKMQIDIVFNTAQKRFRPDYTYISETSSYYKFHTLSAPWMKAKKRCALEGANLFYPEDEAEMKAIIAFWSQTQPYVNRMYLGISDLVAKGVFETVDGYPISSIYNKWCLGEPNNADDTEDCVVLRKEEECYNDINCVQLKFPFICKKTKISIEWNTLCDIPDKTYKYNDKTGKCYKFHLTPMKWEDAHAACTAEQSYLAIINSQVEADQLVAVTKAAPTDRVRGNYLNGTVLLGFHDRLDEGWTTVRGMSLGDSGYTNWGDMQPDGDGKEQCGAMSFAGLLNDVDCKQKALFVCEHDIDLFGNGWDDRFERTPAQVVPSETPTA